MSVTVVMLLFSPDERTLGLPDDLLRLSRGVLVGQFSYIQIRETGSHVSLLNGVLIG